MVPLGGRSKFTRSPEELLDKLALSFKLTNGVSGEPNPVLHNLGNHPIGVHLWRSDGSAQLHHSKDRLPHMLI